MLAPTLSLDFTAASIDTCQPFVALVRCHRSHRVATVKTVTGLIAAYMRLCGFAGLAVFWRTIYVLPMSEHNKLTIEWSV